MSDVFRLQGKKIFYVAPPTPLNLEIYRQHQKNHLDDHETWLGDALLRAGQLGRVGALSCLLPLSLSLSLFLSLYLSSSLG